MVLLITWIFIAAFIVGCNFGIHQIYLGSQTVLDRKGITELQSTHLIITGNFTDNPIIN